MTTSSTRPLEILARGDIESDVFAGEPSLYCEALAEADEDELALLRESVRIRFIPSAKYRNVARELNPSSPPVTDTAVGDPERLRQIGVTRQIERYPGETDQQYSDRLAGAFPAWRRAGTASAIESQLAAFGIVDIQTWEEWQFFLTLSNEYGNRFEMVLGPNYGSLGWTGCKLGEVVLGAATLGIGNADPLQVQAIPRIILKWKHAWSFPLRVLFLFGDAEPLGMAELGSTLLGVGGVAVVEMGSARTLGSAILGTHKGVGFNL